ncbi:acyltransferase 3 [Halenospora varia]|nr:acyltransferase 3 [Halenospora varia]
MSPTDYKAKTPWANVEETIISPHADYTMFISSGVRIIQKTMFGIIPSFIQRRLRPLSTKQQRLHPTSYLDGLRGVASFIVFMGHYTEENLGWYTEPYGLYEDGAPSSPLQLPFIRVIYSARPMVHIFFIISGYVLAYKPLMQIHSQRYANLAGTLSSSVFRRALRLFLPSFITLFAMAVAVFTGLSEDRYAGQYYELSGQLHHVWDVCWGLLNTSWNINDISSATPPYNPALWTIPVEFAQSLILFVIILGLARCQSNIRLLLLAGVMAFCFYGGHLYSVEFLGGLFIAEINLLSSPPYFPNSSLALLPKYSLEDIKEKPRCVPTLRQKAMQMFWVLNVVSGLFIASWTNNHIDEVPFLAFLNAHTPSPYEGQKVWFCLGAFQIVTACTQLPSLQCIFNTSIAQYLGQISYALYLTHNLCLTVLEPRVVPYLNEAFGKGTSWGRHCCWGVGLMVYLPVVIWVSDVFWRAVDTPTVKFARWVESKCLVEFEKKS